LSEIQLLWCLLNTEEDYKEKASYNRDMIESLLPWLNPQMYSKMKERERLEEETSDSEYQGYVDELRQHGVPEEEIKRFIDLEKRSKREKEARQKELTLG